MRNFRNNFRRGRYKNHSDRNNHKNENGSKMIGDFQNGSNFIRKNPSRNNHNASKLVEKYSNLAIEALSSGDKILSENYYQHAEHFIRILGEKEVLLNKNQPSKPNEETIDESQKKVNGNGAELSKQNITTEN